MLARMSVALAALLAGAAARAQAPAPPSAGVGFGGFGGHGPMEQPFEPLSGKGRFWDNPAIVDKLRLTDDQRKAMDDVLQKHLMSLVDLRANAEKAELALRPLINADQLDEQRILSQIDQVAAARADLFKANARFLLAIRSKLTPEQWKTVQEFRSARAEGLRRWRQGAPQGGPPDAVPQEPPQ